MSFHKFAAFSLGLSLSVAAPAALGQAAPPKPGGPAVAPAAPAAAASAAVAKATSKVSTESDRKSVSITVYNGNFGLVREVRELRDIGRGTVALEVRDVASTIQPETVAIQSQSGANALSVLE